MIALGPFSLDAPIGKGGMGEVWRGMHTAQGVPVAIKLITSRRADEPRVLEALRNEVRAVARLHHSNIILLLDHGVVDADADAAAVSHGQLCAGSPYLAMELVSGGRLGDAPPADWPTLRGLLVEILDALGHAHARGVIHRDLKPSNILLGGPNDLRPGLRLSDFGLAHALDRVEGERERVVSGTPRYMAPEQIAGSPRDEGPWTDLYALGVIAWQLVTGALPFGDADGWTLMRRHLAAALPPLVPRFEVPAELEAWIVRLLAKRPCNRFTQAADAAWALRTLVGPMTGRRRRHTAEMIADAPTHAVPPPRPAASLELSLGDEITDLAAPDVSGGEPVRQRWEHDPIEPPPPAPPMPATWQRSGELAPLRLLGAGLGLYGVRSVPMVGRGDERDALWQALRTVSESRTTRVISVHGAAGCGKSRLVQWIGQRAHEVGAATVLRAGHGPIAGPQDGLAGMAAALLRCAGERRDAAVLRCQRFLDEHAIPTPDADEHLALTELALGEDGEHPIRLAAPADRFFVLRRLLARVAARRPVLLWLDDVQWGGDALAFVELALEADRAQPLPLLFVLTVRDEAMIRNARPLEAEQLAAVERHPETRQLEVGPLSEREHAALVERLLGLSGPLVDRVVARTAGNPLFAVQMVGDWVQRGVLVAGPAGFELAAGERAIVPDDIHALWTARVERILTGFAPAARIALERAATLGLDVDGVEWRAACGHAAPPGLVDALVSQRLALGTERAWSFAHALLRESLERAAADAGRFADHHRACAAMLASTALDRAAVAERAAHHLLAAGEHEAALSPLLIAAERRRRRGDLLPADALFEEHDQALRALPADVGDPRWGAGWVRRARVHLGTGRTYAARALLLRTVEAAEMHHWPEVLARALAAQARLAFESGETEIAYHDGHRALRAFAAVDDPRGRAECLIELGATCMWRWQLDEAMAHYRAAHELATAKGDLDHVGATLRGMGNVLGCEGHLDRGAELLARALDTFQEAGSRVPYATCLNDLGELARLRGDLDGALALYRQSAALHTAVGSAEASTPRFNLGLVLLERGRFAEARRDFEALAASLAGGGRTLDLLWTHIALVACAAAVADWPAWDAHLAAAEARLGGGAVDEDLATLSTRAADLTRDAADLPRARRIYAIAAALWDRLGQGERATACREALNE